MDSLRFKLDEEWFDLPEGMETFGELRDWVISRLKREGRILLGTMSGDASLTVDEMSAWGGRPVRHMEVFEFFSAEPMALACRTCEELVEFMSEVDQRGERTAASIDAGDIESVVLGFKSYVEGWDIVLEGYRNLIKMAEMDPATLEIGRRPLPVVASELRGLILKMADEFAGGDMEGLKRVLSEEMVHYVEPVREALEEVQERLEEIAA